MQWQLIAKDPEKEAAFYGQMFGWEVSTNNALNYRTVDTNSERGINGGIWPATPGAPGMTCLYVEVEDVAAAVQKATRLGGKTLMAPQVLPDGDEMALLLDPEGIPVGLFKPAAV
jgi:predicted enzyme related to lactoylglutathione lyase